jgi:hypothetical protein
MDPRDPGVGGAVRTVRVIRSNPGQVGSDDLVGVLIELTRQLVLESLAASCPGLGPAPAPSLWGYGCPAALLDGADTPTSSVQRPVALVVCDSCVVLLKDVELPSWDRHPPLYGH